MITWTQILYGAALSAVVAGAVLMLAAERRDRWRTAVVGALATGAGAVAWNSILHAAHGDRFFTDAPVVILPASWQDTGSGVFALAVATILLSLVTLPDRPARRVTWYAVICGLVAFLVDVYLY